MELISRKQAIQVLEDLNKNKQTIDAIKNLPIIEERPKGKWKERGYFYICDQCQDPLSEEPMKLDYCPNCGAKMENSIRK